MKPAFLPPPLPSDITRFAGLLGRHFGFDFPGDERERLTAILRRRLSALGQVGARYLDSLEAPTPQELRLLAQELTVTETSFFRNEDQMRAFNESVLADRAAARASVSSLRILSAGCSSGEEPYSLAILLALAPQFAGWDISITGLDANIAVLRKALAARYSPWSLRSTPPDIRAQYFTPEGDGFVLNDAIRHMVRFEERNLVADDPHFWAQGSFDIIFCRNVTMYFQQDIARQVMARLARALAPGGFLFLGHAETMRGLSGDFELCHTHGTFYYRRRQGAAPATQKPDTDWSADIAAAARRIQALAPPLLAPTSVNEPIIEPDMDEAAALIGREEFARVAAMLQALPPAAADSNPALLLRALVFSSGGNLAAAEEICAELLRRDPRDAGAHYLTALCRQSAGDAAIAAAHGQAAASLDSDFAMPRLQLGLMARRAGKPELARRDLVAALILLEKEQPRRLALFGGGFSRQMLIGLCRTELTRLGDPP